MYEPSKITAGMYYTWTESLSDYPATTYTLKYSLINQYNRIDIVSAASGNDHKITLTSDETALYASGTYQFVSFIDDNTNKILLAQGIIEILPNITTEGNYDYRTHARKTLEAIEAMIERRASKEQSSLSIQGRSLSYMTPEELIKLRSHYKYLVDQEIKADKINAGLDPGGRVLTRFNTN